MARTFSTIKITTESLDRLRRVAEVTGELKFRLVDRLLAAEEERLAKQQTELSK